MLNKVILQGRLGKDVELKTTPNGIEVATVNIAVDRDYKKQGEERETDWVSVVAWRNTAVFFSRYFKKGDMVIVEGSLQTRSYNAQDGSKRFVTEVVADSVYFAGDKKETATTAYTQPTAQPEPTYMPDAYRRNMETLGDDEELPF